jgi:hypothetical protein
MEVTMPRILTAPLFDDDLPRLATGDNWIAWYDGPRGAGEHGSGNTEARAVADLIENHPRGYPDCERTIARAARIKRLFSTLHSDTIAALQAAE